jgi:hypothetical protein
VRGKTSHDASVSHSEQLWRHGLAPKHAQPPIALEFHGYSWNSRQPRVSGAVRQVSEIEDLTFGARATKYYLRSLNDYGGHCGSLPGMRNQPRHR